MSHPDPLQDYDDSPRYWQEVGQFRPLFEARELRRLTRQVYEGDSDDARRQAVALGLGPEWTSRLLKVHRRLTYKYRNDPSMRKPK